LAVIKKEYWMCDICGFQENEAPARDWKFMFGPTTTPTGGFRERDRVDICPECFRKLKLKIAEIQATYI